LESQFYISNKTLETILDLIVTHDDNFILSISEPDFYSQTLIQRANKTKNILLLQNLDYSPYNIQTFIGHVSKDLIIRAIASKAHLITFYSSPSHKYLCQSLQNDL
jgi:hypothetical protein